LVPTKTLNVRGVKALPIVGEFAADANLVAKIVDEGEAFCPSGGTRIGSAN
jgi:hypothetical protein